MKRLRREHIQYTFSKDITPALKVGLNEEIVIETADARSGKLKKPQDVLSSAPDFSVPVPKTNPATGPIYFEGVEPGHILAVDILDIKTQNEGFTLLKPDQGVLFHVVDSPEARIIKIEGGRAIIAGLSIPIKPMIGVIGTTPSEGEYATLLPGYYGGNLDNNLINKGARIYFPVEVPGALLAIGDIHALMGDGEITSAGLEIEAEVTIKVQIADKLQLKTILIENDNLLATIGVHENFYGAAEMAISAMLTIAVESLGVKITDAYALLGLIGDLKVSAATHGKFISLRFEVPKKHLKWKVEVT